MTEDKSTGHWQVVTVAVVGGCAMLVSKPDNVKVVCRDYDIDGSEKGLLTDKAGDQYREFILD